MSEWVYDSQNASVLIGINPSSNTIIFPSNIERIGDFDESQSILKGINKDNIEISFEKDSKVVYIGLYAFAYNKKLIKANLSNCLKLPSLSSCLFAESSLSEIILPENGLMTILCTGCFKSTLITKIHIPDTVTTLEKYKTEYGGVFGVCSKLYSIEITKNSKLNYIGYAFGQYSIITSFFIPKTVTLIDGGAFSEMRQLSHLYVDEDNENYYSIDDIIYNKKNTTLHTCAANKMTKINILDTVVSFGLEAFRSCRQACEFIVPGNITIIPSNCFMNSLFTVIIFPPNLKEIQNYGMTCTSLKEIVIPPSVTRINDNAFFSSSVETIYFQTYEQNVILTNLAFAYCQKLISIHIPQKGVSFQSSDVFKNCINFKYVYYIIPPLEYPENIFGSNIQFNIKISKITINTGNNNKQELYEMVQPCGIIKNFKMSSNFCSIGKAITCKPKSESLKFNFIYLINILI